MNLPLPRRTQGMTFFWINLSYSCTGMSKPRMPTISFSAWALYHRTNVLRITYLKLEKATRQCTKRHLKWLVFYLHIYKVSTRHRTSVFFKKMHFRRSTKRLLLLLLLCASTLGFLYVMFSGGRKLPEPAHTRPIRNISICKVTDFDVFLIVSITRQCDYTSYDMHHQPV